MDPNIASELKTPSTSSKDRPRLSLAWMLLSALGFGGMSIFVKRLSPEIPQFELVLIRSVVNFLIVLAFLSRDGLPIDAIRDAPGKPLLFFRGLAGFLGVSCMFYTLGRIPLPIASMLSWCSPLFVLLFSRLFLGERMPRSSLSWIGLAFVGLVLILLPDRSPTTQTIPMGAVLVGLFGAAWAGSAYVAIRAATAQVPSNVIIFYFVGTSTLLAIPPTLADYRVPDPGQALELLLLGTFASIGQFGMTQAYRHAPAGQVSTMSLLNPALAALFGWLLFDERVGILQWIGMTVLAAAIAMLTLTGQRTAQASRNSPRRS